MTGKMTGMMIMEIILIVLIAIICLTTVSVAEFPHKFYHPAPMEAHCIRVIVIPP